MNEENSRYQKKKRDYGESAEAFNDWCKGMASQTTLQEEHTLRQNNGRHITKDDVVDLRIILNVAPSVDEFIEMLN